MEVGIQPGICREKAVEIWRGRLSELEREHKKVAFSVVIPVFNAERTLGELSDRLRAVLEEMGQNFEIIFIDDNSTDKSWEILRSLRENDDRICCFQLMRNFGQQNATMCGLSLARGRVVITCDDDLQNPPEAIPALAGELEKGYDAVFGISEAKKHSLFRRLGSRIINMFYAWTFHNKGKVSAFRAMRSGLVEKILEYDLNFTYINGLIAWYTNRISRVAVLHESRAQGRSGYTLKKLFVLSFNMMTNFSLLPLQIASFFGLIFALAGFVMGGFFVIRRLAFGTSVSGFTAIIASVSFFSGMILFFLGIIGEYIGRIHMNINRKPQYSIRQEYDDQEPKDSS